MYAEVVAGLSAFTAVLYLIPCVGRVPLVFLWDTLLFFLWVVLFGIFGKVRLIFCFVVVPPLSLPSLSLPYDEEAKVISFVHPFTQSKSEAEHSSHV